MADRADATDEGLRDRVLVVDDDPPLRRMLARTLTAEGYEVTVAADGGAALAEAERAAPDVIVLDVAMPALDGLAVCRRLRSKGLPTPILMLTARDAVPDRVAGLEAGADDYLVKPFAVQELIARLRALTRRGSDAHATPLRSYGDLTLDTSRPEGHARRAADRADRPRGRRCSSCCCARPAASSRASARSRRSGTTAPRRTSSIAT